ncbi:12565_t:CDS:2 [Cetraspora pellucida]|uniref:12565_t:CDS:1 n=1 Tax=Cetraspora pellucida TaxID=1433469 RepID=A0A9N9HLQ6_9GLOM|nr:12565_t:CDS:2 [Cetraspora pellucida]
MFLISIIVINSVAQNRQNEINICVKKLQSQDDSEYTIKNSTTTTNITEFCEKFTTGIIVRYGLIVMSIIIFLLFLAGAVGKHAAQLEEEYPRYDHSTTVQE